MSNWLSIFKKRTHDTLADEHRLDSLWREVLKLRQDVEHLTLERDDARAQRDELNRENEKLHAHVKILVEALNEQSNEIDILRERSMTLVSQLTQSQAEVERLNEAAHPALLVEEEKNSNEAQSTVETTTVQSSTKPVRAKRRTTTSGN